jgi:uncharacterized protein YqgC (DUF456 family)
MDLLLIGTIILGTILIILAFIGCIIPALPGPPLAFLALLLLKLTETSVFSTDFIITMALITAAFYFLDYILPIFGAKIFKASKQGIWFSIIGMIVGIFFFPPFGIIIGLLLGAIIGELIAGKAKEEALKIGFVSFMFSLLAILIKIALVGVMAFYFSKAIFEYYI